MFSPSTRESQVLLLLGAGLRRARIDHDLCQTRFAERIGVSVPTYRRMEQGHAAVPIGYWIRALHLLGMSEDIPKLFGGDNEGPPGVAAGSRFHRARIRTRGVE